jgi:hypothetical protein
MTRLPELERQLMQAARALEKPRRRWWRIGLLSGGATLAVAATAVGAVQLLLPEGDPVPPPEQRVSLPDMDPGTTQVLRLRAPDPEGGPPWGMALSRTRDGRLVCLRVGRVQDGRLGIVGRDGAFDDDGRFHPLAPDSNQGGNCGGIPPDGELRGLGGDQPPIPASGYTGDVLGTVGGCREDVPLDTMSPANRRLYRDIPVCTPRNLRVVKFGFAGRDATRIEYAGRSVRPDPKLSGAYLFVLPATSRPLTLTITYADGQVCRSTYPRAGAEPFTPCPR